MITHIRSKIQPPELQSETKSNGQRCYVLPDGSKVPSITTILSYFKREQIQEWRNRVGTEEANKISKRASGRGTNTHALMEKYINNEPSYLEGAFPDAVEMFKSVKPYLDRINNVHFQECTLYSQKLSVAGRTDIIAEYDGILSVIDLKTSSKPKKREWMYDYFIQECFYALAYHEMGGPEIDQLVTIIGIDHEKPVVIIERTEDWIEPLVEKVVTYRRENK